MRLWSADAGKFWVGAILSLPLLLFIGMLMSPRMSWENTIIFAPLGLCCYLSVRAGSRVDFWTRAAYGFGQSIVLIFLLEASNTRGRSLGDPVAILCAWAATAAVYSVIFALVTQGLVFGLSAQIPGVLVYAGDVGTC